MEYYTQTPEEALSRLDTDRSAGLSSAKVKEHAEKYGRNEFTRAKRKSLLRRIWEALTEPMLILLLCAWAITIAVNVVNAVQEGIAAFDWAECAGILVAVLISVVLTVVMEGRSAKAFDELNKIKEIDEYNDQVVQRSAVQDSLYIFQELASHGVICGIKKNGFFVHQQIGVVGHSVRERENIFEQFDPAVACAHPVQIFCDFSVAVHIKSSLYLRHNE